MIISFLRSFKGKVFSYLPGLILVLLLVWQILPLILHPGNAYLNGGDDAIITWYLNQTIQKIPGHLTEIFNGNIFYPYKNTMSYGVMLIPSALIAYLPAHLINSHVLANNVAIIFSQFFTCILLFLWLRDITRDQWSSLTGTILFAYSQIRMSFIVNIHFFIMHWIILAFWQIWRYRQYQEIRSLYIIGICLILQTWESIYQVYWIILFGIFMLIPVIPYLFKHLRHIILISLGIILISLPVLLSYYSVIKQFGFAGTIRDAAHFSMSLNDIWQQYLSFGLYIGLLISALIYLGVNKKFVHFPKWVFFLLICGTLFALGPVLKWSDNTVKIAGKYFIPLPYGVLFYLLPGLSALRNVERIFWLSSLAGGIWISMALTHTEQKYQRVFIPLILILGIWGGYRINTVKYFPYPKDYPKEYLWLREQPGKVVMEYPIYTWADIKFSKEMYRMIYSLEHKKNLINGASGFLPPPRAELFGRIINKFPEKSINNDLKSLGVDYIVVHKDEIPDLKYLEIKQDSELKILWEDGSAGIFAFSDKIE